jgi:hypothetical protein
LFDDVMKDEVVVHDRHATVTRRRIDLAEKHSRDRGKVS